MDINAMKQNFAEELMKTAEQYGVDVSIYRNGNYSPDEILKALNGKMAEIAARQVQEIDEENQNRLIAEVRFDISEIIGRINRELLPKPMIRFIPVEAESTDIFDSKLGGVPYLPKNFPYPVGKEGAYKDIPLKLLVQLNFEKLPHIDPFPEKGILQIFCTCANDDEDELFGADYGMNYDDMTDQNGFRVIYHENIITDRSKLIDESDLPEFEFNGCNFPFDGEFLLETQEPEEYAATIQDGSFRKLLMKYCSEAAGTELNQISELEQAGFGNMDFLRYNDGQYCCIGGYPCFTQTDPRYFDDNLKKFDTLLFQLDSESEENGLIMWGDMGVANFFIPEENLKKCDFSQVLYNWDCC